MRMFIVRHGESLGNIHESAYADRQDHNVPETQWGYEQMVGAGKHIDQYYEDRPELAGRKLRVWHSPMLRTVQSTEGLLQGLSPDRIESVREDYLLREQDFGLFSDITSKEEQARLFPIESTKYERCREKQGKCYARPPGGENRLDVAQRTRIFKDTMMRDLERGQEDIVIVAHGVTNRALEMDFLHKGVKWFEDSPNPGNADITLIEGDRERGYTATRIYEGKTRPKTMPKDYKSAPYGESIVLGG